jgi:hypothetical protein
MKCAMWEAVAMQLRDAMKFMLLTFHLCAGAACGDNSVGGPDAAVSFDSVTIDATVDAAPIAPTFSVSREYRRLVDGFATLDACKQVQMQNPDEFFNCENWVQFCTNGGFILVTTDIGNEGKYQRSGSANLELTVLGAGDVSGTVQFTLDAQQDSLQSMQLPGVNAWQRATLTAEQTTQLDDGCSALTGRTWW